MIKSCYVQADFSPIAKSVKDIDMCTSSAIKSIKIKLLKKYLDSLEETMQVLCAQMDAAVTKNTNAGA